MTQDEADLIMKSLGSLAELVVDLEEENDSIGATAKHLEVLLSESIRAEHNQGYNMVRFLQDALSKKSKAKEEEVLVMEQFESIMEHEDIDVEYLEALFGGDEE